MRISSSPILAGKFLEFIGGKRYQQVKPLISHFPGQSNRNSLSDATNVSLFNPQESDSINHQFYLNLQPQNRTVPISMLHVIPEWGPPNGIINFTLMGNVGNVTHSSEAEVRACHLLFWNALKALLQFEPLNTAVFNPAESAYDEACILGFRHGFGAKEVVEKIMEGFNNSFSKIEGMQADLQQQVNRLQYLAILPLVLPYIQESLSQGIALVGRKPHIVTAVRAVPRIMFVPEDSYASKTEPIVYNAYNSSDPLEIGHGATISAADIVAHMTDLLDLDKLPDDEEVRILEVGTASGYQAAMISQTLKILGKKGKVYTIEIVPQLAEAAEDRLSLLGYENIVFHNGNGLEGWPGVEKFHRIIVTASDWYVPQVLLEQLEIGGMLLMPVGNPEDIQILTQVFQHGLNDFEARQVPDGGCMFIPLKGRLPQSPQIVISQRQGSLEVAAKLFEAAAQKGIQNQEIAEILSKIQSVLKQKKDDSAQELLDLVQRLYDFVDSAEFDPEQIGYLAKALKHLRGLPDLIQHRICQLQDSFQKLFEQSSQGVPFSIEDMISTLNAMVKVPRHMFIPQAVWKQIHAYEHGSNDLGCGQSMLPLYEHAVLLASLAPKPGERLAVMGAGTGYLVAVVAELLRNTGGSVLGIEFHKPLAKYGRQVLRLLGYPPSVATVYTRDAIKYFPNGEANDFDGILSTFIVPGLMGDWLKRIEKRDGRIITPMLFQQKQLDQNRYGLAIIGRNSGINYYDRWIAHSTQAIGIERLNLIPMH